MRPSRHCSSILGLAVGLVSSSLFAAVPPPPAVPPAPGPAPVPLEASGKQPDPVDAGPGPTLTTPPLPPAQQAKTPVLEVPGVPIVPPPPPPPPARKVEKAAEEEPEPEGFAQGDHFEFTMGFLAGQRSYSDTSFKFEEGTAEGIGGGGLVAPFVKAPFDNATVLGLRYDVRLVMSFIRMTVGFDVPFTTYKVSDSTGVYDVSGTMRQVTVQSLSAKELRFGIGAEYPFKKVAIFADLIGGVHWVDTELAIDGYKANYAATNFAFSGRAGLRAYVRKWFFASASGEVGIVGDLRWNAEFSLGFSIK